MASKIVMMEDNFSFDKNLRMEPFGYADTSQIFEFVGFKRLVLFQGDTLAVEWIDNDPLDEDSQEIKIDKAI